MKMTPLSFRRLFSVPRPVSGVRFMLVLVAGWAFFMAGGKVAAQQPSWWASQGILNGAGAMDYAAANQGQLKNLARAARDEMLAKYLITEGHPIDTMVDAWTPNAASARDYGVINLGQLKAVAKPFYEQLILLGFISSYPWSNVPTSQRRDYAMANLGQLKNLFAFNIPEPQLLNYAPGRTARFWKPTSSNGLVTSGIVAGDQTFLNSFANGINPTVRLKSGSSVSINQYGVSSGTLAEGDDQLLNYTATKSALFKAGSRVSFFSATGFVQTGTLGEDKTLDLNATMSATFKAGSTITFFSASSFVSTVTLVEDQSFNYNATMSALFKAGSSVSFFSSTGFVNTGTLGEDKSLELNATMSATFKANSNTLFSTSGFVISGTLSSTQSLNYNATKSALFKAGSSVSFFSSTGFISSGALGADQPISYSPYQSAWLKNGSTVSFNSVSAVASSGTLAHAQPLYHNAIETRLFASGQSINFWLGGVTSSPGSLGSSDADQDGLIDLFEMNVFGSLLETPGSDFNNNGGSNQAEIAFWTTYCGAVGVDLLGDENLNGLTTLEELMLGGHPINTVITFLTPNTLDTDGDGVSDAQDAFPFDPAPLVLSSTGAAPVIQLQTPAAAQLIH